MRNYRLSADREVRRPSTDLPLNCSQQSFILEPHKNLSSLKGFYSAVRRVEVLYETGFQHFCAENAAGTAASLIKEFYQRIVSGG